MMRRNLNVVFAIAIVAWFLVLFGCSTTQQSESSETTPVSTVEPEEVVALNQEETIGEITYLVSEDWSIAKDGEALIYYYADMEEYLTVSYVGFDMPLTDNTVSATMEGFASSFEQYSQVTQEVMETDTVGSVYLITATGEISSTPVYMDVALIRVGDSASSDLYMFMYVDVERDHVELMKNMVNTVQLNQSEETAIATSTPEVEESNVTIQEETATTGEKNALSSANSYLRFMNFSYKGLIDQLMYEGYTESEATYAADNCGADWNEQAAKSAASYLEFMSFSRSELISQLEYEGFTSEQAEYGVSQNGY